MKSAAQMDGRAFRWKGTLVAKTPEIWSDEDQAKAYIFDMTKGLVKVAKDHDIKFLAYLLEMAALAAAPSNADKK